MRLFLSDESLVVQGRAFVGFPLLVHRDGTAVEPAQSFLWDVLTTNGRAQSPLTWAKYEPPRVPWRPVGLSQTSTVET